VGEIIQGIHDAEHGNDDVQVHVLGSPVIIVDGSTAQINLARHVLKTRGLVLPVIGVVKDERHRAREVVGDKALVAAHRADIIRLNAEAHRFAVGYHRALRSII
jgi:excinuclease ABC subunit C